MAVSSSRKSYLAWAVLFLSAFILISCSSAPPGEGISVSSRSLLAGDAVEEEGFGLYSYLLFGSPPSESSRGRYLSALEAYLELLYSNEMVLQSKEPIAINITYLPVQSLPNEEDPEVLLNSYNYLRAESILNALDSRESLRDGPYIVSYRSPLTNITVEEEYLFQDLSTVPERIVRLWVKEFLVQVKKPEYWRERTLGTVALRLRTDIARAAEFVDDLPQGIRSELSSLLSELILPIRPSGRPQREAR